MAPVTRRPDHQSTADRRADRRRIGPFGTLARVVVGSALLGDVVTGHAQGTWHVASWLLGVVVFPATVVLWQFGRVRRRAPRLVATGPLHHAINVAGFGVVYFSGEIVPAFDPVSDAALIFYGASMVLAAVRGQAGCEVLVVSNWLLRRDDQIGCAVFLPIDALEHVRRSGISAPGDEEVAGAAHPSAGATGAG